MWLDMGSRRHANIALSFQRLKRPILSFARERVSGTETKEKTSKQTPKNPTAFKNYIINCGITQYNLKKENISEDI